jgi:hypothetical protein
MKWLYQPFLRPDSLVLLRQQAIRARRLWRSLLLQTPAEFFIITIDGLDQ